ncbi:hypothetical protein GCM10017562_05810 [Streptomyces roseofulvus]
MTGRTLPGDARPAEAASAHAAATTGPPAGCRWNAGVVFDLPPGALLARRGGSGARPGGARVTAHAWGGGAAAGECPQGLAGPFPAARPRSRASRRSRARPVGRSASPFIE